ncbi:hypothetical protein MJO28_004946 [Puccinia striiformis f. sp. tritici]|uniref:Uncharacterized protein n=1 Tax=Puccinia striiformis f. sp. tritici TaxID=168172 RepID=A0ACC0EKV6_9BASI|nr:hypothetical protein MJO28_004946 [Puccinia striiformis f. sp. tritici]
MAPTSKKRRKAPSSSASKSTSDIESTEPPPPPPDSNTVVLDDSDDEVPSTDVAQSQGLTDAQELKKALRVYQNQQSDCYASFDPPELSVQLDKNKRHKIAYPCKFCGTKIHRPTYDTSPTNLSKHVANCLKKRQDAKDTQKLAAVGVSGTRDIDPREVPQLCAIWCAEGARPFAALGERAHRGILHPEVVRNLPNRRAVSSDIARLYTAVQESFIKQLENHSGAMYLGLDAWQSPNGYDVLGTVIYRLVKGDTGRYELEAIPLDFVRLKESHTGVYLADTVRVIVEKFGLQNKICGIVTDNASNNETMIEEIKRFKWPRFKGQTHWIRCFAHILNLIAQVIMRPFGSHKKKEANRNMVDDEEEEEDISEADDIDEVEDPDEQIKGFNKQTISGSEDEDDEDCVDEATLAADLIDEGEVELEIHDVNDLSDEGEDDDYTSQSCRQTLSKFRAIARKLKKSPNSKALFVGLCRDKKCLKPHNVERDLKTRWNSTLMQLTSIVRCSDAILEWQKDKRYGPARQHCITSNDLDLARDLIQVLQPFYEITLQVSTRGGARIAQVVVFIDQITSHLSTAISNKADGYPPALRNVCRAGIQLTNKYYTLTDCSPIYRVAMILHPSFKDEYFKLAKWQPDWIDEAIRLAREMWENHYKSTPQRTTTKEPNARPKPAPTGVLAGLSGASEARAGQVLMDPLNVWLAGGLHLDDEGLPVNPLKWWISEGRRGNTYGGLLQMALDVLSCPATTVDVERSFSFGRDYVSNRRHRLNASSVTKGMTVAFYSKNDMIKPDGLEYLISARNHRQSTHRSVRLGSNSIAPHLIALLFYLPLS